jgi:predicted ester cyclase
MLSILTSTDRRQFLAAGVGLASPAGLLASRKAAAAPRPRLRQPDAGEIFPFALTDEDHIGADDRRLPARARKLIRVGGIGIAREDPAALAAFFHPEFRFHGPRGAELDREQLWGYFAACRAAFDDFTVTRQTLVSDGGEYIAARTRFAGTFVRPFTGAPEGRIEPNGRPFEYRLVNIFRYARNGQLIEEWVQYDVESFLSQLRKRAS